MFPNHVEFDWPWTFHLLLKEGVLRNNMLLPPVIDSSWLLFWWWRDMRQNWAGLFMEVTFIVPYGCAVVQILICRLFGLSGRFCLEPESMNDSTGWHRCRCQPWTIARASQWAVELSKWVAVGDCEVESHSRTQRLRGMIIMNYDLIMNYDYDFDYDLIKLWNC